MSSPSPRLCHPGIPPHQPGVTPPRIYKQQEQVQPNGGGEAATPLPDRRQTKMEIATLTAIWGATSTSQGWPAATTAHRCGPFYSSPMLPSASGLGLSRCCPVPVALSTLPCCCPVPAALPQPALQLAGGKLWPHQVAEGTFTISGPRYTSSSRTP